ncbi:hypothetical protein J6TS7_55940 [Paenibacillus dendritiformis]|uniref:helix-turn-helix domain-containing protein n=1 Tax=Paenibacillus TaxID=44249 RepID=UPI001B2228A3|nr:hypothetical protein J6TS7_55940 [Paenibacillus dendritiformis]
MERIYTPEEAALRLRIHKDTMYKLLRENKVKHFRIGRRYFIRESALEEFIKEQEESGLAVL